LQPSLQIGNNLFILMFCVSQIIKRGRSVKLFKSRSPKLLQSPQKKGVCLKVFTRAPKKPNSANRRIAKIIFANSNTRLTIKIIGEGHNLQQHSTVLVRGGSVRDLVGVRYLAVRGIYDLSSVKNRKSSRSLYGVKDLSKV
jgi:small subunit ribosomal protein S12